MAANSGQTEAHLGYFASFMKGWGKADDATRAEVYATTQQYAHGYISADTEVREVSIDLDIPIPAGY